MLHVPFVLNLLFVFQFVIAYIFIHMKLLILIRRHKYFDKICNVIKFVNA